MNTVRRTIWISLCAVLAICTGCSVGTEARPEAPESAKIPQIEIPFDAQMNTFALYVEPVSIRPTQDASSGHVVQEHNIPNELLHSVLISTLNNVGNFSILDERMSAPKRSTLRVALRSSEQGPYIVRTVVTEMNGFAEIEEGGFNPYITGEESIGMMVLKFPAMVVSFWVTQITSLPTNYKTREATGVVALDVSIIDGKTGRLVRSFPVRGTHKQKMREIGTFVWGLHLKDKAESSLVGAIRVAFNEAATRIHQELGSL